MLRMALPMILALLLAGAQGTTYWCPMHPDQRATTPIACPICRMTMVPMPPLKVGEYQMAVSARPNLDGRGASGIGLTLLEPDGKTLVRELDVVHERPLHLFVVDRTLEYFAHVHPDRIADGRFDVALLLPPGEYMVVADFAPSGGAPQTLQRAVFAPGADASRSHRAPALGDTPRRQTAAGLIVTMEGALTAGETETLTFSFTDAATGGAATDLEPYLGAPAHLLAASADLTDVQHAHPESAVGAIRQVAFDVTPAAAGAYKLWLQFQRRGQVVTVPFVIHVAR